MARYVLMNVLVRIRNSHARRFVPSSNVAKLRYARRYVSWTRSSASAELRVIRMAALNNCGAYCIASVAKAARSAMAAPYP